MGQTKIRRITPALFADPLMAELCFGARYLYLGLPCIADDHGVVADDPWLIQAQMFPQRVVPAAEWVDLLVAVGRLVRKVTLDGTRVLVLEDWEALQYISPHNVAEPRFGPLSEMKAISAPNEKQRRLVRNIYNVSSWDPVEVECEYCAASGVLRFAVPEAHVYPGYKGVLVSAGVEIVPQRHPNEAPKLLCRSCRSGEERA